MLRPRTLLFVTLVLTVSNLVPSTGSAQTLTVPLKGGDPVSGMGAVLDIRQVFVNDSGTWFALVETDFPDLERNEALLRDGAIVLREGDLIPDPPGTMVNSIGPQWWTDDGKRAMLVGLQSLAGSSEGVYFGRRLLAQTNGIIDDPGLPANSKWKQFDAVAMNSSRTILVVGNIDTPTVPGAEDFVARLQLGPAGELLSTEILVREGLAHPAITGNISRVGHEIALNERGDFMMSARGSSGDTGAILINGVAVARHEESSPAQGREYAFFSGNVDLNDFGDWAFIGAVHGDGPTNHSLVVFIKNDQLFAQEGEVLPSLGSPLIEPSSLTGESIFAPICLTNSGDLFWVAQTENGDAFMRNRDVLVREGGVLDGRTVSNTLGFDGTFHASDDGRYWVGTVVLDDGDWALVRADLGLVVTVPGCLGNRGSLRVGSGLSVAGHQIELQLDDAQAVGALPILTLSLAPAMGRPGCGIATPLGEILISPAAVIGSVRGPVWNGSPSSIVLSVPDNLALVGLTYYAQGLFWDAAGRLPGESIRLTNAIRGEIGAP